MCGVTLVQDIFLGLVLFDPAITGSNTGDGRPVPPLGSTYEKTGSGAHISIVGDTEAMPCYGMAARGVVVKEAHSFAEGSKQVPCTARAT